MRKLSVLDRWQAASRGMARAISEQVTIDAQGRRACEDDSVDHAQNSGPAPQA